MSIHQNPLAYLLGLEGVALHKAFAGAYDEAFTPARIAEIRGFLGTDDPFGHAVDVAPLSTVAGYDGWAPDYDNPDNGLFAIEERHVWPILDRLPVGATVDIACGTGRHAGYLAALGHEVRGFDISPRMLDAARINHPSLTFELADVRDLPLSDASVDNVVCALALAHVEDLRPVFTEAARVLRPGGRFVVSDTRGHFIGSERYPLVQEDPDGNVGYMLGWRHSTVKYLQALLEAGFGVRKVLEPVRPEPVVHPDAPRLPPEPGLPPNVWALHAWVPEAANAAKRDDPVLIIWDLDLTASA